MPDLLQLQDAWRDPTQAAGGADESLNLSAGSQLPANLIHCWKIEVLSASVTCLWSPNLHKAGK